MNAGIVDYRMGNLASVAKAVERVGGSPAVSEDAAALKRSDLLILPGVGNFAAGMANLRRDGLDGFLREWAAEGRPLIGICLGMQLLFERSEEGDTEGLGVLPGKVVRLRGPVKVPHMGWNVIRVRSSETLVPFDGRRFYFVHSYVCVPSEEPAATTEYGEEFAAAVETDGIAGVQFHPEKSASDGLALLGRVLDRFR